MKVNILKKDNKPVINEDKEINIIETLAGRVLENKKRIEEQKMDIYFKIDELKKELDKPTHVKQDNLKSFSIEDIEKSTEPVESRGEISRKIAALMNAKDMNIYNDKQFINSIKEYLEGIRSEIERIDKKQWDLVKIKREVEAEYNKTINEILKSYNELEKELQIMLKVADISYPRVGFEKRFTPGNFWGNQIKDVTYLIDKLLNTNDGETYSRIK